VSLCRFHHHRHHEGAFRIVATEGDAHRRDGGFRFETADGRPIGVLLSEPVVHRDLAPMSPETAAARGGGAPFDLDHTIVVLAGNTALATRRGAEQPSGP
jgi:hypothetical protein